MSRPAVHRRIPAVAEARVPLVIEAVVGETTVDSVETASKGSAAPSEEGGYSGENGSTLLSMVMSAMEQAGVRGGAPVTTRTDTGTKSVLTLNRLLAIAKGLGRRHPHEAVLYRTLSASLADAEGIISLAPVENPEFLKAYTASSQRIRSGVLRFLWAVAELTGQDTMELRTLLRNSLLHPVPPRLGTSPIIKEDDPPELVLYLTSEGHAGRKVAEHVRVCVRMLSEESRSAFSHDDLLWLKSRLQSFGTPQGAVLFRSLTRWLRWLIERKVIPYVVIPTPIACPRVVRRRVFTPAELDAIVRGLVSAPDPLLMLLLITLLHDTGARISDVLLLCLRQIDSKEQRVIFVQQKTGREVVLPLHPRLWLVLYRFSLTRPPIALDAPLLQYRGRAMTDSMARKWFKRLLQTAKINLPPHHAFHVFRHTLATELLAETGDSLVVAKVLGVSLRTADSYIHNPSHAKLERLVREEAVTPW